VLTGVGSSRSGLEGHVLVGGEESHELWHLDDLDASTLVDIEMLPGFWEVGGEVGLLGGTGESLMGLENLGGSGSGGSLGHDESTRWGTILVLLLVGVGLDHGSHEEIIGVTVESWGDDSLVGSIDLTVHVWGEDLAGVVIIITVASEGDVLGIGVGVRLGGLLNELDVVSSLSGDGNSGGLLSGETEEGNNSEGVFHLLVVK
jgi:hypothetical protein